MSVPSELNYIYPSGLAESKKYTYRNQPSGNTSVSSAGSKFRFVIPRTDRNWLVSSSPYVTGYLNLGTAGVAGTDINGLLGTAWSCFSRLTIRSNGQVLEDLEQVGVCFNTLLNQSGNDSDVMGMSPALLRGSSTVASRANFGIYSTGNTTIQLNDANLGTAESNDVITLSFAIPLFSLISQMPKYMPLFLSDIEVELIADDIIGNIVTLAGSVDPTTFTLNNMEFVYDTYELSSSAFQGWMASAMASHPDGKLVVKTASYSYGSTYIASTSGSSTIDVPISQSKSSVKAIMVMFSPANGCDRKFGSVNPNLRELQFRNGNGMVFPNSQPLNLDNPAMVYMENRKSFGTVAGLQNLGSVGFQEFRKRVSAAVDWIAYTTTEANADNDANKFVVCIPTSTIDRDSEHTYDGTPISTNATLRLVAKDACAVGFTVQYFLWHDRILTFDIVNNIITAMD